jgi:hypothetical protein
MGWNASKNCMNYPTIKKLKLNENTEMVAMVTLKKFNINT